jgi:hypothetical protein
LPTIAFTHTVFTHDHFLRNGSIIITTSATMKETTPSTNHRRTLLPVETLKERCLEEYNTYTWNEFRLGSIEPDSVTAFGDFFLEDAGKDDGNNLILWIAGDTFVRVEGREENLPQAYRQAQFRLWLTRRDSRTLHFSIHSSALEGALDCLDFLVGLQDDHYDVTFLSRNHLVMRSKPWRFPDKERLG